MPVLIAQSWTWSTNSASQCQAWAGSCQPKHKAGLNDYCPNQNWTPAVLTKLCQTPTCSRPNLLWILAIRKDFHTLRTGKQWSSLSKASTASVLGHFWDQAQSDLTADPAWSRRLDQIISQGPFQTELSCESQLSPPLTHTCRNWFEFPQLSHLAFPFLRYFFSQMSYPTLKEIEIEALGVFFKHTQTTVQQ